MLAVVNDCIIPHHSCLSAEQKCRNFMRLTDKSVVSSQVKLWREKLIGFVYNSVSP